MYTQSSAAGRAAAQLRCSIYIRLLYNAHHYTHPYNIYTLWLLLFSTSATVCRPRSEPRYKWSETRDKWTAGCQYILSDTASLATRIIYKLHFLRTLTAFRPLESYKLASIYKAYSIVFASSGLLYPSINRQLHIGHLPGMIPQSYSPIYRWYWRCWKCLVLVRGNMIFFIISL